MHPSKTTHVFLAAPHYTPVGKVSGVTRGGGAKEDEDEEEEGEGRKE